MKYVLLKHQTTGEIALEVGFAPLTHGDMAERRHAAGFVPTTAGFVRFVEGGRLETYGESRSLKLAAHPDDSRVLFAYYKATSATATP